MQLSVMLFASYADAFGRDRLDVEIADGSSVATLVGAKVILAANDADFAGRPVVVYCIYGHEVGRSTALEIVYEARIFGAAEAKEKRLLSKKHLSDKKQERRKPYDDA